MTFDQTFPLLCLNIVLFVAFMLKTPRAYQFVIVMYHACKIKSTPSTFPEELISLIRRNV